VVEGAEPPADWLGKVYALHQAAGRARGEWVLVVDSDVIMDRATVRAAIRLAERRGGDAVAMPICPEWRGRWPQIIIPASAMLTILAFDVRRRRDPSGDPAFVGGAFMLIRREALERIGGFASVKDQLPEGVQLALRLKRQGYRLSMEWIPGLLRTPSYASLKELWRGYQLVAFPALGHRYSVALAVVMMDVLIFIGPSLMALGAVVSLAVGWLRWSPALWPVFIAYAAMVIAYAKVYRLFRVPWVCSFIAFVGHSIMIAILLTSAWAHLLDRGLVWRGRRVSARRESGIR
jgi:cellulose synthase/poly-beta-1,6-N-acetylglucosamine synthase-like glycosyltransferase